MLVTTNFTTLFLARNENTSTTLNNDVELVAMVTSTEDPFTLCIELESEAFRDKLEVFVAKILQLFCQDLVIHQLLFDLASYCLEVLLSSRFWLLLQGVNAFL